MAGSITVIKQGSSSGATSSTEAIVPDEIVDVNILDVNTVSLADGQIAPGQVNIFADETNSKLKFKYNNDVTILTGEVSLS